MLNFGERKANNAVDSAVNDTQNHTSYYERLNEERETRKKIQSLLQRENKAKVLALKQAYAQQQEAEKLECALEALKAQSQEDMARFKQEQETIFKQNRRDMEAEFRTKLNVSQVNTHTHTHTHCCCYCC
jgi:regulator of protease activity HflC (stomatin/prohibitin superfamily)